MKSTKLVFLTIFSTILISILNSSKTVAHEYCESYLDCHQKPEHLEKVDYSYYIVTLSNYRTLLRTKSIDEYERFYRKTYRIIP